MTQNSKRPLPSSQQLKAELKREKYKQRYSVVMKSTFFSLLVVAAIAVLITTLFMPVLRIHGSSMTPTLDKDQIVVSVKGSEFEPGDLVAFYMGNKILVKRVIACPGDWLEISEDGTVYVNGDMLDEPYISGKALGQCDLEFPYQIPESRYFMMGDHRESSVDSRSSVVGCITEEQIVGRIFMRVWPLSLISFF